MNTGADISTLYREFTDALTEVLAENAQELARLSKSIRTTASLGILWQSKTHSKIGKPYKTLRNPTQNPTANQTF
jgi:hypothetical protein